MHSLTGVEGAARTPKRSWPNVALLTAVFASLYLVLMPDNRSETDDGYGYAYQVRSMPFDWRFDSQHALLIPLGKGLSGFTDPYATLVGVSLVLGLASIVLFYWLLSSLGFGQAWALAGAVLLGASYGFWRYAVEAETYTIATATALLLVVAAVRRWPVPWLVLFAVFTLLAHLLNVAVVLFAVPVLLWRRREKVRLGWYLVFALPMSAVLVQQALGSGPTPQPLVVQDLLRLPIGVGQSIVAANGLLGLPGAAEAVSRLFPSRDLSAELVIAEATTGPLSWAAAATLCALLATAALLLVSIARGRDRADSLGLWLFGSWLAGYGLPAATQDRGNPELWIIATVPLWGLLVAVAQRYGRRPPLMAWLVAVALTLHSVVAGFLPVLSGADDANQRYAAYLRDYAPVGSLVVTNDNQVLTRYLRYELPVTVVNLNSEPLPDDLSGYPAVYVMPSAAGRIPYELIPVGNVYRIPTQGRTS